MPLKWTISSSNGLKDTQMQLEYLPYEPFQMPVKAKNKTKVNGKTVVTDKLKKAVSGSHAVAKVNLNDVFYQEWSFNDVFLFECADVLSAVLVPQVREEEEEGAIREDCKKK
jgi:hypothetical protein